MEKGYLSLDNLITYRLARELSRVSWEKYLLLSWEIKKILGFQFIESTDSVGANIAEGFGRFHYLDKVKFYYNARGSLLESRHWIALLKERGLLGNDKESEYLEIYNKLGLSLNALIKSVKSKNS